MLLSDMLVFCVSSAFDIKKCEYQNRCWIHIDLSRNSAFLDCSRCMWCICCWRGLFVAYSLWDNICHIRWLLCPCIYKYMSTWAVTVVYLMLDIRFRYLQSHSLFWIYYLCSLSVGCTWFDLLSVGSNTVHCLFVGLLYFYYGPDLLHIALKWSWS